MPIQSGDIKLLKSDTMADVDEGGGSMTANVVQDNISNNIFDDISTLDRVYGAVHMRKVFPAVQIQTTDKYYGAHAILSKLPGDGKIGVNLFNSEDWFDRRPAAQSRVEDYRAKGAKYNGWLWATQWTGTKVINVFQPTTQPLPEVGSVMILSQGAQEQYVKVQYVEGSVQTYQDGQGAYNYLLVSIEISQPLDFDFDGIEITRTPGTPAAELFETVVANASKYYSARPISVAPSSGSYQIQVEDVYSQLIPSSLKEDAIVDEPALTDVEAMALTSTGPLGTNLSSTLARGGTYYLPTPCEPGSVRLSSDSNTLIDQGGQLIRELDSAYFGDIDYRTGQFTYDPTAPISSIYVSTATYTPAAPLSARLDGFSWAVTENNRGNIWINTFPRPPRPLSVKVAYMALGNWYYLYDDGSGALVSVGGSNAGGGSINYETGTVSITTTALPDVDSAIIFYGSPDDATQASGSASYTKIDKGYFEFAFNADKILENNLTITLPGSQVFTTNTDGTLSGPGTGVVDFDNNKVLVYPDTINYTGTDATIDYQRQTVTVTASTIGYFEEAIPVGLITYDAINDELVVDLSSFGASFEPGAVKVAVAYPDVITDNADVTLSYYTTKNALWRDDGLGVLYLANQNGYRWNTKVIQSIGADTGTIDYVNGIARIPAKVEYYRRRRTGFSPAWQTSMIDPVTGDVQQVYGAYAPDYVYEFAQYGHDAGTISSDIVTAWVYHNDPGFTTVYIEDVSTTAALGNCKFDFDVNGSGSKIVEKSLCLLRQGTSPFTSVAYNNIFYDVNGIVYYNRSKSAGTGTQVGTIDYVTGRLEIDISLFHDQNFPNQFALLNLATTRKDTDTSVTSANFNVPSAPVKTQSFNPRIVSEGGDNRSTISTIEGYINDNAYFYGTINYSTGVVALRFGEYVPAAGNETQPWYDPDYIVNGEVFQPKPIDATSFFYNAVIQSFLPLDPDILGLNPVRLPQDGRVPIYDEGDVVVVLNEQSVTGTYVNTDVVDFGRGRIAKVVVRDAAGQLISNAAYTTDLDVGTLTWVDVTGIAQPVTITNRIEDMSLVTDVQINGTLTLSSPLTHNFPLEGTLVSNAVIYGDLYARTSIPFDQATWTGVWADYLIGSETSAQYNYSQYPFVVDNYSTIQERWYIYFTSSTVVNVIGENVGQIATGIDITTTTVAPINPNTSEPYFTIPAAGWGSGWSAGNILRFNTYAANAPLWIIQSVGQGEPTDPDYNFCIEVRGDIDTP